jgi:hypothetical protein
MTLKYYGICKKSAKYNQNIGIVLLWICLIPKETAHLMPVVLFWVLTPYDLGSLKLR